MLEALGFELELPPERIAQSIDELGFGFMFAQAHHPAMQHAAPVRRELAARTVFNVLGPLTNPAGARAQVVGVYSPGVAGRSPRRSSGSTRGGPTSSTARAGSTSSPRRARTSSARSSTGEVREYELDPLDLGIERCDPAELRGGDPATNARALRDVLAGAEGGHRSAVLLNAAGAIAAGGHADDLREGLGARARGDRLGRRRRAPRRS